MAYPSQYTRIMDLNLHHRNFSHLLSRRALLTKHSVQCTDKVMEKRRVLERQPNWLCNEQRVPVLMHGRRFWNIETLHPRDLCQADLSVVFFSETNTWNYSDTPWTSWNRQNRSTSIGQEEARRAIKSIWKNGTWSATDGNGWHRTNPTATW